MHGGYVPAARHQEVHCFFCEEDRLVLLTVVGEEGEEVKGRREKVAESFVFEGLVDVCGVLGEVLGQELDDGVVHVLVPHHRAVDLVVAVA